MVKTQNTNVIHAFQIADHVSEIRHVFIRDLLVTCLIGIHKYEKKQPQEIRINIDLGVTEESNSVSDRLENVVCYEELTERIRNLFRDGHVNLLETLAEQIADICLFDKRVRVARIRVEKLHVFQDASSVGIEIERQNKS